MAECQNHLQVGAVERAIMGYPVMENNGSLINNCGSFEDGTFQVGYARKAYTPSPKKLEPWLEFLPRGSAVKPTQRPLFACSKKNVDTFQRQEERDKRAFDARAHRYRAQVELAYHHHNNKEILSGLACPEDHIVSGDKGRRKPDWCRSTTIFDPITASEKPCSPNRVELRPGSAPSARPKTAASYSSSSCYADPTAPERWPPRPGTAKEIQGRYNPLTHTWLESPDPAAQAVRQKESDRIHGFIGIRTGNSPSKATVQQALCRPSSDGTGSCSSRCVVPSSNSSSSSGGSAAGVCAAGGAVQQHGSRPTSAYQDRRDIRYHGDTWGTYDCLRHKWTVPPKDARYVNREAAPDGVHLSRSSDFSHTKRVPLPANQGVYDPIKGEWKVPPRNQRVMAGLEFAPAKVFEDKRFVAR